MSDFQADFSHIDFALDPVPDLHAVLADLRSRHAVAPVNYHGDNAYLITRFRDVQAAL